MAVLLRLAEEAPLNVLATSVHADEVLPWKNAVQVAEAVVSSLLACEARDRD
jgi:hypothetical protein